MSSRERRTEWVRIKHEHRDEYRGRAMVAGKDAADADLCVLSSDFSTHDVGSMVGMPPLFNVMRTHVDYVQAPGGLPVVEVVTKGGIIVA